VSGLDRRAGNESGFTVVELVAAASILLIVVSATMTGLVFATQSSLATTRRSEATTLANQQVEYVRNLENFDNVASTVSTAGLPAGQIQSPRSVGIYTITTDVSWGISDTSTVLVRTPYKNVIVRVSWQTPRPGNVTLDTRVAGKDTQGLYNRGSIKFVVKNEATPALPVTGVEVQITDCTGDVYVLPTGADGTVVFQNVPAGTTLMSASKSGYMVTGVPTSISCVANTINDAGTGYAKLLRSARVTIRAPSGVTIPYGSMVSLSGGGTSPAAEPADHHSDAGFWQAGFWYSLIAGSYTVNFAGPTSPADYSACYNTVSSAGTLVITSAQEYFEPAAITLPTSAVKSARVYVESKTSGTVYVWTSTGVAFKNPGSSTQCKVILSGSSPYYKGYVDITNSDHLPARHYFSKTATWSSTSTCTVDVTAGSTYYSSTSGAGLPVN